MISELNVGAWQYNGGLPGAPNTGAWQGFESIETETETGTGEEIMSAPNSTDTYSERECLLMLSPTRTGQSVTVHATEATAVTLRNPVRLVNNTNGAGNINYTLVDTAFSITEYFAAGQEKLRRVSTIGSTASGTTIATVLVLGN